VKHTIFVDGQEGTTGLEINERLAKRDDVEILRIAYEKRRDAAERKKYINQADIVFLCLPDDAAREAVSLVENPHTRIIDASTAHRTAEGWAYGIPELSAAHRADVQAAKRVSNPGCFATGFNALMYPLVKEGIVPSEYPVTCHSVTGYSGGGKKLIERFASEPKMESPNFYALGLTHKHLPEMQKHSGLAHPPLFTPIVANYYRGMTVAIPLFADRLNRRLSPVEVCAFFHEYYAGQTFVRAMPFGAQNEFELGFLNAEGTNGTNTLEIFVCGNEAQILVAARLDNLGKGASGAAVQNMNIMLGLDETTGLA